MRIHLHYLKNNCFLDDGELINNCSILGEKKVFIIQGSDDPICPKKNALKLHSHLKNSEIELVKNTGMMPLVKIKKCVNRRIRKSSHRVDYEFTRKNQYIDYPSDVSLYRINYCNPITRC